MQAAINAAAPNSTIYICPGTYNETIAINENLTLIGAGSGTGTGATILDPGLAEDDFGRPVTIEAGFNVTLRGMRITGGSVTGGVGDGDGGGIYNDQGTLTMTDCVVWKNEASRGAGIFTFDGEVTMTDCDVNENHASGDGGGIYVDLGAATLNASSVTGNIANSGGGIYNDGTVTLNSDSTVSGNKDAVDASNNCRGLGTFDGTETCDSP